MKRDFTIKELSLVLALGVIALAGLGYIYVMQVSPLPLQRSQPTSSESAVPAPSAPPRLVSSTPEPKAPTLTPSQAEGLTEANRYLDAKDYTKALPLLQRAADAGSIGAMNSLGLLYTNGWGVVQNYAKAFDWFLHAAKLGDSYAMMKVGKLYLRKGTGADDAEGFRWLNEAYTAPKPNLEAGAYIADCYLSGKGTKQDVQKAEEIVMPLAKQNVVPAMTLAGRILQYRADIKRSEAEANSSSQMRKKLEAEANELDRQGRRWWERAEKDDWNAAAHLGKCYEEGWCGVEKNEAEAEKRYKAGASHGNPLSLFFSGLFLEKKPERKSEAAKLIAQAAEMDLPSAMKWCKDNNVPFNDVTPIDESAEAESVDLTVKVDSPGASIALDEGPALKAPHTFTNVKFGTHKLIATYNDFTEPVTQEIQVVRGMTPEIHMQLKSVQEIAALSIYTDPPGAEILLDGKSPQAPPNTFTHVPFGSHQISATLEGYGTIHQDIEVRRGMAPEVHLQLPADQFALLLNQIKKYPEDSAEHVTALMHLVQLSNSSSAPKAGEYTKELASVLERLRTRVPPIDKSEFNLVYKDSVKDAASLDIVPAIVWLAENAKLNEASDLFLRAAKLGDSYAMMKLGRLYLKKGTSADDAEGFRWLNEAYTAPKPNLEAGAFVADCYLSGKGTTQDVQKAEEIVMPLANQNVVPAMTVAGQIAAYKAQQSIPAARRDELYRQARQWWEGAAEKGDWNASAYLGQQYELGIGGVERNEEEAEQRYKAGASHGNPLSLFFSGLFLEKKPERQFRKLPHYRFTLIRPVPKFCWTVNLRRCPQTPLLVSHLEPIG